MNQLVLSCLLGSALLFSTVAHAEEPLTEHDTESPEGPRHVILIIGDGMDEQQITIARNYLQGAAGQLLLDQM